MEKREGEIERGRERLFKNILAFSGWIPAYTGVTSVKCTLWACEELPFRGTNRESFFLAYLFVVCPCNVDAFWRWQTVPTLQIVEDKWSAESRSKAVWWASFVQCVLEGVGGKILYQLDRKNQHEKVSCTKFTRFANQGAGHDLHLFTLATSASAVHKQFEIESLR